MTGMIAVPYVWNIDDVWNIDLKFWILVIVLGYLTYVFYREYLQ